MSMPTSKKAKKIFVLNVILDELVNLTLHEETNFLANVYHSIEDAVYDSIPSRTGYFSDFQLKEASALIQELQEKASYIMFCAVEAELRRSKVKRKKTTVAVKRKKRR